MKKTTKAVALFSSAVLLVTGSVLGTLAYLTDTESAVNTFTVGKVDITVDETDINGGTERVKENEYKLVPGESYTKDPTMTVLKNSEEAYVRMILTVTNADQFQELAGKDILSYLGGMDDTKWILEGQAVTDTAKDTVSYEYRYADKVSAETEDVVLEPLFSTLTIPTTFEGGADLEALAKTFKIEVTGHAIQAAGFADDDAAWAAFPTASGDDDATVVPGEAEQQPEQ